MQKLDTRLNAFRSDLADETLRGKVEAAHFVKGFPHQITTPIAAILKRSEADAPQTSQALMGETCLVFENKNGWAWVKLNRDHYVGYINAAALTAQITPPTHKVIVPSTLIYPKPDLKTSPVQFIMRNAEVCVTAIHGNYAELKSGGFVSAKHLSTLQHCETDFVAVAEEYLHVPYFWGGKSVQGIDCSGLVQTALHACGTESPRDSDMQENVLGTLVKDQNNLKRGDLIFWQGHVGIMQNATQLLHANGHAMKTTSEPLAYVVARSEKPITAIKRLA
jgi:cell wall-associated NlpC family hydrolase